jgi:catechol 2,3-dioxygenase-like lactoylglutathione lyase family enzyme
MTTALLLTLTASFLFAETPQLRVSMISLGVKDPARSVKFYNETLGLPLVGKPGEVTLVKAGDITIVLNQPLGNSAGGAIVGAVEVIFPAESVAALHRDLTSRGCTFVIGPHEVTTGLWAATFTDPDGHRLTILGPK